LARTSISRYGAPHRHCVTHVHTIFLTALTACETSPGGLMFTSYRYSRTLWVPGWAVSGFVFLLASFLKPSWSIITAQQAGTNLLIPEILDCRYDTEWIEFQELLHQNAILGFPFDDDVFEAADRLIARHLGAFLEFHRSKSNEFFHDCDRVEPKGVICLYGMLTALLVHTAYIRHKLLDHLPGPMDKEVLEHSLSLARLMVINKNNCLDFFDSSSWSIDLATVVRNLDPRLPDSEVTLNSRGFVQYDPVIAEWQLGPGPALDFAALSSFQALRPRHQQGSLGAYVTGTHVALAREPAEMLQHAAHILLDTSMEVLVEVVDDQHCDLVGGCSNTAQQIVPRISPSGKRGLEWRDQFRALPPVGLRELVLPRLRPRWTGLDIEDLLGLVREFRTLFAGHPIRSEADVYVCSSPVVLCRLLSGFGKPLLAYLGEPLLLGLDSDSREGWFREFEVMVKDPSNFFMCYNPFLSDMIEYQTGLSLPVVRLHGLYTRAVYAPRRSKQVLVVKGPNICLDPPCLLNRFSWGEDYFQRPMTPQAASERPPNNDDPITYFGMDEIAGMPYSELASFKATIIYPYDVALAIFYELYSMQMPLFLPRIELLPFYVFRGLHADSHYHYIDPLRQEWHNKSLLAPFIPSFGIEQWWTSASVWSAHTDFARFPHLLRFGSVSELFSQLRPGATDFSAVSAAMKRFNDETFLRSTAQWASAVASTLHYSSLSQS